MNKKANHIDAWYMNLAAEATSIHRILTPLRERQIRMEPWHNGAGPDIGLILLQGIDQVDSLVSFLQIQLKERDCRIIACNISPVALPPAEVIRIFGFGVEYYFESAFFENDLDCIACKINRWQSIDAILSCPWIKSNMIGSGRAFRKLIRNVVEIALYSEASILVQGERGTGKELIAKLVHEIDKRKGRASLVLLDCTTIRPELSGSEFFGHEKGSYTGADHTREGAFALADNGTLFLDEVGELPMTMQAELLRVIQEGAYKKLGSNTWRQTRFRLVCATNRNLETEADKGNFRKDLFDRISLWKCRMPPLQERREDIPALVDFFLLKKFPDKKPVLEDAVKDYLVYRTYHGNIRELQNLVMRMSLKYSGAGPITLGDIPEYDRQEYMPSKQYWYERAGLIDAISEALEVGHDAKGIIDTVKSLITKTALACTSNNKEVSQLLGKSERWIQLQKAKDK